MYETLEQSEHNDFQVEPERHALDVVEIKLNPLLHFFERVGLTSKPIHLSPTGNARLDFMAQHVAWHQLFVVIVVRHDMRARSDNGHAALQHVVKLRQFIEAGTP